MPKIPLVKYTKLLPSKRKHIKQSKVYIAMDIKQYEKMAAPLLKRIKELNNQIDGNKNQTNKCKCMLAGKEI